MSHFSRVGMQVAPHYLHAYPTAPRGVHPVMPLMPVLPYTYGAPDLGAGENIKKLISRKFQSTLRKEGANLAVYDLFDAVDHLDDMTGSSRYVKGQDVRTISTYQAFATLAANDSSALLKTAYWLKLAGLITGDGNLKAMAYANVMDGYARGEQPGAASLTNNIVPTYTRAYDALVTSSKFNMNDPSLSAIATELAKGKAQSAISSRVSEARQEEQTVKQEIPTGQGGAKEVPCEDTLLGKLPGYCAANRTAYQVGLGVAAISVLGFGYWVYTKLSAPAPAAANPKRSSLAMIRTNPSAPGRTDFGPESDIAKLPSARIQEQRLMKNVFKGKV